MSYIKQIRKKKEQKWSGSASMIEKRILNVLGSKQMLRSFSKWQNSNIETH